MTQTSLKRSEHWPLVQVGDVADLLRGVSYGKEDATYEPLPTHVPVLRATNIQDARLVLDSDMVYIARHNVSDVQHLRAGDIVLATSSGSKHLVGKSALLRHSWCGSFGAFCAALRPKTSIDPRYLAAYLQSPVYWKEIRKKALGVNINNLRRADLETLTFQLPPLAEQETIVAEIEKQFSRLDEAVANLKRVKANLKRYRAAVLKAAVEGRLVPTEADLARKEGRMYETGSELLKRILSMRRKQWSGRSGYVEPSDPNAEFIPDLPKGWALARLDAIASLKGGITVDKGRKDSSARSVPYLRVANVQRGYLDLSDVKQIDAPAADVEQLRLLRGDILFNEGGDRDKLGRGWIWEDQLADCIHQNHVFRARLFSSDVESKLVSWWGNSFGKDYFSREGKQTTNLASINITKLSAFPIPIPPAAEQARIVAEVDRHFSLIHGVEEQTESALKRAERLRNSVLACAFTGTI